MSHIDPKQLFEWCKIPADQLEGHPDLKANFRLIKDSAEMGKIMAGELIDLIEANSLAGKTTRAIIPCGPACWYKPWTAMINERGVSLKNLVVFHMDECLDWQGQLLPAGHPLNFRSCMEDWFYGGIPAGLNVPDDQRYWPAPDNINQIRDAINEAPLDITYGGWGQDGHIAYNQARRNPYSALSMDDVANSTIRIQDNNTDTIIALAQRNFGAAWQFVPPMSVTLGVKECLSSAKVRVFSDTGSWKQTALRVALFGGLTPEYPMTLLQKHPDSLITATVATATHPISENPQWPLC